MQLIKPDINIDFVGVRRYAYGLSLALILASIISLVVHGGPKYGIDFAGGAEALVKFDTAVPIEKVKSAVTAIGLQGSVQEYGKGGADYYRILIDAQQAATEDLNRKLQSALETETQTKVTVDSFEEVGPQVGNDMRQKALGAIFFALLLLNIYISGRFEFKWLLSAGMTITILALVYVLYLFHVTLPILIFVALLGSIALFYLFRLKYAMGAIVALMHDVIITVGCFSFYGKEFSLPIVAAILTIIGYSLNDTIIVFDRIRENLRKYQKQSLAEIINRSVNETLSRTILTSGFTLLVVIALFFLGGGIIHDFAFALLVGIVVGTYSSIYVASPILLAFEKNK
ncbi:MAG: protein translocase subunit SecF [Desulfobacteraceae bacterium]|nr:protein translocase subunit SecF [Desulfobacteraceae bacterium]